MVAFYLSRRRLVSFISLLVALLVPRAYVQPGVTPENAETAKIIASSTAKVTEQVKSRLSAKGFSAAGIDRLQKCAQLCGITVQAKLRSKILWLRLNHTQSQVAKAIATESLKQTVQWLSEIGLAKRQVSKAITTCPAVFCSNVEQNLEETAQWLLVCGLSHREIVRTITTSPRILEFSAKEYSEILQRLLELGVKKKQTAKIFASNPDILGCGTKELDDAVQWLLDFGFTQHQIVKLICFSPKILGFGLEEHFKPRVVWLLELGLSQAQAAKAIVSFPTILDLSLERVLTPKMQWLLDLGLTKSEAGMVVAVKPQVFGYSIEQNLKPKVQWIKDLGLNRTQITKMIVGNPCILGYSFEDNLKRKVQWLIDVGLAQDQVAKVIAYWPSYFRNSLETHLEPKRVLLQKVFGTDGAAEEMCKMPQVLSYSYQRLSSRLKVLVERNETMQLRNCILLTEDRFRARYLRKEAKQKTILQTTSAFLMIEVKGSTTCSCS